MPFRFATFSVCLFFSLFCNFAAHAKAPVWKISKDDRYFYLGGTIHLLSEKDYPLPDAFQSAFSDSQTLVFETDIEQVTSIAAQAKFLSVLMLPAGQTLESMVKPDTYSALKAFLEERQLPITAFERFTPAGLNMTLVVLELQRLGITGTEGVEAYMNSQAKGADKRVEWLETMDEQIGFINKMNDLDADKLIMSTIRDTTKLSDDWPKLLNAWRQGDMDALEDLGIDRMLEEAPAMYEFILADRNRDWMADIKTYAKTPEIEFILVGALHLAGKDSVLNMLQKDGYKVTQLD